MSQTTVTPTEKKNEWSQAEGKARDAAADVGEMAVHAASAVGAMATQAASDVGKRADEVTASAGLGIQGLSDRLSQNAPQSGMLGTASQAVAKTLHGGGEYLEDAKLSGMTEDLAQLIRRNPIPAVLVGIGLGWFVASKLRG